MAQSDIREELHRAPVEPLLPIEKKLIGWSLTIGLVLLVGLAVLNHFIPATFSPELFVVVRCGQGERQHRPRACRHCMTAGTEAGFRFLPLTTRRCPSMNEHPRLQTSVAPQDAGLSAAGLDRLSAVMQREVETHHVPGISMLIARGGKVGYRRDFGALKPGGPPMPDNAIFRIFSMTKPIVSVALMILLEEEDSSRPTPSRNLCPNLPPRRSASTKTAASNWSRRSKPLLSRISCGIPPD